MPEYTVGKSDGQITYEAYKEYTRGKSLVSGEDLPQWADQDEAIRAGWEYAASVLVRELKGRNANL
jgi:hypothetical protein